MGRSPYQSEKRRKELARLKKQEEKRQRRFNKKHEPDKVEGQPGDVPPEGTAAPEGQIAAQPGGQPAADFDPSQPGGSGGTSTT